MSSKPELERKQEFSNPYEDHSWDRFPAWYDSGRKGFWTTLVDGNWVEVSEGMLRRLLKCSGYSGVPAAGEQVSQIDRALTYFVREKSVEWAGPLAGYWASVEDQPVPDRVCQHQVLVTKNPMVIVPKEGDFSTLERLFSEMFGDEQIVYVLGWLKCARQSFDRHDFRPGQMLALAGPAECGKSLFQNLVTEMLGGRSAKPYRYMTGNTQFNSELFGAEHLMIEDDAASTDLRSRRDFGSALKNLIVNETQSFHAKGRNAMTLRCFWRVTISLNDEPENMMVLPPLDESLKDKMMLIKVSRPTWPAMTGPRERQKFRQKLSDELPGFLHHLLHEFRIPRKLVSQRYGIREFHNPELLEALESLSPEFKLLTLVETLGLLKGGYWEGSSDELDRELRQKDGTGQVQDLLKFNTAAGVYLARLRHKRPNRVELVSTSYHKKVWKIRAA